MPDYNPRRLIGESKQYSAMVTKSHEKVMDRYVSYLKGLVTLMNLAEDNGHFSSTAEEFTPNGNTPAGEPTVESTFYLEEFIKSGLYPESLKPHLDSVLTRWKAAIDPALRQAGRRKSDA